jgi:hypothetical protein
MLFGVVSRLAGRTAVDVIVGLRAKVGTAVSALLDGRINDDGDGVSFSVFDGHNGPVSNGGVMLAVIGIFGEQSAVGNRRILPGS